MSGGFDPDAAATEGLGGEDALLDIEIRAALRKHTAREIAKRLYVEQEAAREAALHPDGRWMSLDGYLDGEYVAPIADLGADRDDGVAFLYPGKWHTLIGLTTAGKTFFALWQAKRVMEDGGHVIYVHFEEPNPAGTVHRLLNMGADREMVRKQFHWPENRPWTRGEMEQEIERLTDVPTLAVLDGINAACGDHGWDVSTNQAVGAYRGMFVAPLTTVGCAVLSLGHPVKAPGRQTEAYSYGAAGWLNDVDGVSYRLRASSEPINRGGKGASSLSVVKDRYGDVQRHGILDGDNDMPWYYMGQFVVDDTITGQERIGETMWQHLKVTAPSSDGGEKLDKYDQLGQRVTKYLGTVVGWGFSSQNSLETKMRAAGYTVSRTDLTTALERLSQRGHLLWPEVEKGSRPGRLPEAFVEGFEEFDPNA